MALVCEAAFVADFCEAVGGLDDFMASLLDAEVADVFLWGHVETGFEFPQK